MIWRVVLRGTAEQVVTVRAVDAKEAKAKAGRGEYIASEGPPEFDGSRWPGRAPAEAIGLTFEINEVEIIGPPGAVAYVYATDENRGGWVFDEEDLLDGDERAYARPKEDA